MSRTRADGSRWSARAIADHLEAEIRDGRFRPGQRLPSLAELGERFGVHRDTAATAYGFLKDRWIARGDPGVGIYVRPAEHLKHSLNRWQPPLSER